MRLVVIGAAGKTGRQLVEHALARGDDVTALVRSEYPAGGSDRLRIVKGDARNEQDLMRAMQGQEAIISALGSENAGDELMKRFTESLIAAAEATGVKRIVMLSTFLVTPNYRPNWALRLLGAIRKGVDADKTSGEDLLKRSDLEWTIVYATRLDTVAPGAEVRVVEDGERVGLSDGISRADVADFMLKAVSAPETIRKSLLITAKR